MNFSTKILILVFIYLNSSNIFCVKIILRPKQVTKVVIEIHETNMYDEEIDRVKNVFIKTLSKKFGTKKTARVLKDELDSNFTYEDFKFSVVINSNLSHILAKKLFGIWVSMTANNKHYLLIASYPVVKGKDITEAQMDRIEDWTSTYFIKYENIINFDEISEKLKQKLDNEYGRGNAWAVIIYKNKYDIRAQALVDTKYVIEFPRLNKCHLLIFRGGEEIEPKKKIKKKKKLNQRTVTPKNSLMDKGLGLF